jgi:hypothetical protein
MGIGNHIRRGVLYALATVQLAAASGQTQQLPCDVFDYDGDGTLSANTWLYVLSQYGTSPNDTNMDVDGSGLIGFRDVLQYLPYQGESCPVSWADTTNGHILGLVLVEHATHSESLSGIFSNLPAESVTYRLYAELAETTDDILAVYGDEVAPLTLETEGTFFGFGDNTTVIDHYQPLFDGFFPANAFSTWFTMGADHPNEIGIPTGLLGSSADWSDGMGAAGLIQLNDSIGGGWFRQNNFAVENTGFVLIGQFTVTETTDFHGTINLLAETEGASGIEFAEGLTFSSASLSILGCMDVEAVNFDAEATHEPAGTCMYAGDFNGDDEFTVDDFLELISDFGCTTCPMADLNDDGIVSVQDILIFLTWL